MFACRCVHLHEHLGKFCGATCQQELRVWMPPHRTKRIHSIDLPHDLSVCFGGFHICGRSALVLPTTLVQVVDYEA